MRGNEFIVDFHSHILPRVDHGSDSLETTLLQLKAAKKNGVNKIVSTSHFYPTAHNVDGFLKKRNAAFRALLESASDIPEIRLGAEVLLCDGIDRLPGLDELCLQGTKNLLLELPFTGFNKESFATIERLVDKEFFVILAHPHRYPYQTIKSLLPLGVKLQLNADSIIGFNRLKNKYLFDWISEGRVVALGSDIHGRDSRAYGRLRKAFSIASRVSDVVARESYRMFLESTTEYEKHKA